MSRSEAAAHLKHHDLVRRRANVNFYEETALRDYVRGKPLDPQKESAADSAMIKIMAVLKEDADHLAETKSIQDREARELADREERRTMIEEEQRKKKQRDAELIAELRRARDAGEEIDPYILPAPARWGLECDLLRAQADGRFGEWYGRQSVVDRHTADEIIGELTADAEASFSIEKPPVKRKSETSDEKVEKPKGDTIR